MVLLALAFVASSIQATGGVDQWPQMAMVLAVTVAISYFVLGLGRRSAPEIIEILPRVLRLPFGSASVEVPLDEVEGLALEEGNRPGLFVSTHRFVVFFPRARFQSAEAARAAHEAIKGRIAQLPGGSQRVAKLDTSRFDQLGPARRPWGSEGLVALFILVLGVAVLLGAISIEKPLEALRLGANARVLVAAGDWWRVPASVLLHLDLIHILLISMSLFGLGVAAERLLGTLGFLVVFAGSALAGALASAAFPEGAPFTMGASGGVFGLLGALLYIYWRFRGQIPLRFQIPERTWFGMLAINFLLPLLVPSVDGAMHLGGMLAGVLLTMLIAGDARSVPVVETSGLTKALLLALGTVYLAGAIGVARAYDVDPRGRQLLVARTLVGLEHADPQFLNVVAWLYAIGPEATAAELVVAEKLAERAVDLHDLWVYRDTWATVAFRRGDVERAVGLEVEAITDEAAARKKEPKMPPQDRLLASQLARFLEVQRQRSGALHQVEGVPPMRAVERDGRVRIEIDGPLTRAVSVWVLAREGESLAGVGRYPVLPTSAPTVIDTRESLAWSRTASLAIGLVSSGTVAARAWPIDASVLEYPGPLGAP